MAPKPKPWFRVYTEITRDLKIRRLKPEHRWLLIAILCIARSSPEPGRLVLSDGSAVRFAEIADEAALSLTQTKNGLKVLADAQIIAVNDEGVVEVTAWNDRS